MSFETENYENREIEEPIHFKCGGCQKGMKTTYENTLYVEYENQPWFNHIRSKCEDDNFTSIISYKDILSTDDEWEMEDVHIWASQFEPMLDKDGQTLKYCEDDKFIEFFRQQNGIQDIQAHQLSPGHEVRIRRFGDILLNMPDKDIMAEFELPQPPRTLPGRWI